MPPTDSQFDRVWDALVMTSTEDDIQDRTGYSHQEIVQAHIEIFMSFPGMTEEPRREQLNMWGDYVNTMVNNSNIGRRNDFWNEVGVTDRTFNWEQWRQAMGYGRDE